MANKKRLPLFTLNGKHKGPMISLITRLLIVAAVFVSVVSVVLILHMQEGKLTWPTLLGLIMVGIIVMVINYLFWRPRYKKL